jgi:hypothetical protein
MTLCNRLKANAEVVEQYFSIKIEVHKVVTQEKLEATIQKIMQILEEAQLSSAEVIHLAEQLKIMSYSSMVLNIIEDKNVKE